MPVQSSATPLSLSGTESRTDTQLLILESTGISVWGKAPPNANFTGFPSLADVGPIIIHCLFSSLAHGFLSMCLIIFDCAASLIMMELTV